MRWPAEFVSLLLRFANRVREVGNLDISEALLGWTPLYLNFGLPRTFDAADPTWQRFLAGYQSAADAVEWTHSFYLSRATDYSQSPFGCFSYQYEPEQGSIRFHFGNHDTSGHGPASHEMVVLLHSWCGTYRAVGPYHATYAGHRRALAAPRYQYSRTETPPMTSNSSPALAALHNSQDRLDALVRPLTPEQLRSQSYDKNWSIAQVLSHLGSGAEIALLPLDAAVNGVEAPGREAMAPIWDAWNARSPDQQAADALVWDARHVHRLENMTPEQQARVHVSFGGRDFGVEDLTRLRLGEHAVHVWDIAVMQDPAAEVASDAVAVVLDNLPMTAQWSGKAQGRPLRVRVRTQQPDREFLLEVAENVRLTPSSGEEEASAELVLTAEAFVRLVYGRIDPEHTPAGIEARNVDLEELRQIFPGF